MFQLPSLYWYSPFFLSMCRHAQCCIKHTQIPEVQLSIATLRNVMYTFCLTWPKKGIWLLALYLCTTNCQRDEKDIKLKPRWALFDFIFPPVLLSFVAVLGAWRYELSLRSYFPSPAKSGRAVSVVRGLSASLFWFGFCIVCLDSSYC